MLFKEVAVELNIRLKLESIVQCEIQNTCGKCFKKKLTFLKYCWKLLVFNFVKLAFDIIKIVVACYLLV